MRMSVLSHGLCGPEKKDTFDEDKKITLELVNYIFKVLHLAAAFAAPGQK